MRATSGEGIVISRRMAWQYIRIHEGHPVPREMKGAGGLIVMGGPMAVYQADQYPFLRDEMQLIERAVTELAREPNGGLIVTASNPAWINREAIITLAARYRLPAVYSKSDFVVVGGLDLLRKCRR